MSVFAFGPFRLDPREQILLGAGRAVALTPKALDLLGYLVEHHGRLVRKEELLEAIWPGTFVEEAVLSVNISAIRRALGDDRNEPIYIETVPRRGYRFIALVQELEGLDATAVPVAVAPAADAHAADGAVSPSPNGEPPIPAPPPAAIHRPWRSPAPQVWAAGLLVVILGVVIAAADREVRRHPASPPGNGSIAVLPLETLSRAGDEQQLFADEMTDMLITSLGQLRALRVVSRQSIVQYRDSQKAVPAIARELNVKYIAEGTVARDGDRVRITAQLIDAAKDRHVWARSYERDLQGTFALQREVADSIAREIGVTVTGTPGSEADVPTEAYEAYLRGNYQLDAGNLRGAISEFHAAIAAYPRFGAAYARLASSYFGPAFYGGIAPREAWGKMKEAALKALECDENLAEAHSDLALVKLHFDWDWPGAEREFRRSLALNPSDADVRHNYAHYLLTIGQAGASLDEMERAFEIDPVGDGTAT